MPLKTIFSIQYDLLSLGIFSEKRSLANAIKKKNDENKIT